MYYVYLLECEDGTIYAGITTDPARRFAEHSSAGIKGAKYTKSHRPVRFIGIWQTDTRSSASKLEYSLKQLSHLEKTETAAGTRPLPETGCSYIRMKQENEHGTY